MEIERIDSKKYEQITSGINVFSSMRFLELNSNKVDDLVYVVGKDTKERFAFAFGIKNNEILAPFSAPFSTIIPLKKTTTVEQYWDFVDALVNYARSVGVKKISLYLPSDIYDYQNNVKVSNALLGHGFSLAYMDINYSFNLKEIDLSNYMSIMHYNARKSLKIAMKSELQFEKCDSLDMKKEAYEIIKINRESRGFPLRMTLEQVLETIQIVEHRFFLLKHDGINIASAVVFHVTDDVAQVVYWGNIPNIPELKPINYLSYKLLEYYKEHGFEHLDIGISTEHGIPNYGLCSFKDSIGCETSFKCRYELEF